MNRRTLLAATLALAAAPALPAGPALAADSEAEITSAINQYMNSVKTMHGAFVQVAPDGVISEGEYWIRRPGRMRFEYARPSTLTVIADGFWVAVLDQEFDKAIDRYPISETPLRLVLEDDVDLAAEFKLSGVEDTGELLRLTASDPEDEALGEVTMVFDKDPLKLKQWIVIDPQGLTTTIALRSSETNIDLEAELFVIPEPSEGRD